jgi:O-antigen/teichoic acid export membrane protein
MPSSNPSHGFCAARPSRRGTEHNMKLSKPELEPAGPGLLRALLGRETWALTDQAVVSATNFLTNVMLARFMGLREFGIFALAWMSVLFANSIQNALIIAPLMSIGPKQQDYDRPRYFGAVFFQEFLLVVLCFILVFAALLSSSRFFSHVDLHHLALPLAISAVAYQGQDFIRRYFFSIRRNRPALIDDLISYVPQLPIIFMLHRWGRLNSATALWAMAGTSLVGLAIGWLWVEPLKFEWQAIKGVWLRHWKISRWLSGSALLQWTSGNLFIVAAPVYYGAAAAGVLKASQNLMGVTHVWFQGLDNVVPAETARRLRNSGVADMLAYTRSILAKWGGLTLVFALAAGVAPDYWLHLIYGAQMAHYGYILRLYALLYVIIFLGGPLRAALQALEFTAPIFCSYMAMTAFAATFAGPATKWMGLNGSMAGLIATQLIFQSILAVALILRSSKLRRKVSAQRDANLQPR